MMHHKWRMHQIWKQSTGKPGRCLEEISRLPQLTTIFAHSSTMIELSRTRQRLNGNTGSNCEFPASAGSTRFDQSSNAGRQMERTKQQRLQKQAAVNQALHDSVRNELIKRGIRPSVGVRWYT